MNTQKQAAAKRITCTAGIRTNANGDRFFWVESPRTGKRIEVAGGWCDSLPTGTFARTVKARSEGKAAAEFSVDELHLIKAVFERMTTACTSKRGESFGAKRRRPWGA